MTLGERIYNLRTGQGMTQEQLAEKMGVSRQSVSKWETDSAVPDIEKLKLLTEILGVSIAELVGMEEKSEKRTEAVENNEKKELERLKRHKKSFDSNHYNTYCGVRNDNIVYQDSDGKAAG